MRVRSRVSENSLKTREVVRAYNVPVSDSKIKELISWYDKALQKTINIIWGNMS